MAGASNLLLYNHPQSQTDTHITSSCVCVCLRIDFRFDILFFSFFLFLFFRLVSFSNGFVIDGKESRPGLIPSSFQLTRRIGSCILPWWSMPSIFIFFFWGGLKTRLGWSGPNRRDCPVWHVDGYLPCLISSLSIHPSVRPMMMDAIVCHATHTRWYYAGSLRLISFFIRCRRHISNYLAVKTLVFFRFEIIGFE